uniref:Uncharacterized protein n=1 Tax=Glossina palpalis gambiensis TaxID=67801 RepID=A0A1B0BTP8_9MUSC
MTKAELTVRSGKFSKKLHTLKQLGCHWHTRSVETVPGRHIDWIINGHLICGRSITCTKRQSCWKGCRRGAIPTNKSLSASPEETESPTLLIGVLVRLGLSKSSDNSPSEVYIELDNLNVVNGEFTFQYYELKCSPHIILTGKRDREARDEIGAAGSDWLVLAEQQTLSISKLAADPLVTRLLRWDILGDSVSAKLNCDEELELLFRLSASEVANAKLNSNWVHFEATKGEQMEIMITNSLQLLRPETKATALVYTSTLDIINNL